MLNIPQIIQDQTLCYLVISDLMICQWLMLQVMIVVPFSTDAEAVALANDCDFGLGSTVFCANMKRARAIALWLEAGMTSINDFNATYMCQSLPFGGVKQSGFGRFGGIEGLRALCIPKVCIGSAVESVDDLC